MKYGLNQAGFPADDFRTACRIAADAGYDGVEPNYVEEGLLATADGREEAGDVVAEYELAVPAISTTCHWEYPLSSPEASRRERGIEIGKEMIDAADALCAEYVLIVPAFIKSGMDYDAAYDRAVDAVSELTAYGARRGVEVAIENVQNNFLYSPAEFESFLADVSDAGTVSVYFDIGNGIRWGLPERWLRSLGEHIVRVHVKDWLTDSHRVTYPLQGDIDWESVCTALADIHYDGWMTAEVPPYESRPERMPPDVLETMRSLFDTDIGSEES